MKKVNLETPDKTQAFTGLAKQYDKARPTYPKELFTTLSSFWQAGKNSVEEKPTIADVGCGTGISTRAIYGALNEKCEVIGIEPGKDMLKTARESSPPEITYVEGGAENLPLKNNSVDIITAAQAAQWFDRPKFYEEAKKVLKPNGVIAIFENNRDWEHSKFLEKHEEFLENHSIDKETGKAYSRYYRDFPYEKELAEHFSDANTQTFFWNRKMEPNKFLEMAKTSTQVKKAIDNIGEEEVNQKILENVTQHTGEDGQVDVPYNTKLYIARLKAKP